MTTSTRPTSTFFKAIALYYFCFHFVTAPLVREELLPTHSETLNTDSNIFPDLSDLPKEILRPSKKQKISGTNPYHLGEDSNRDESGSGNVSDIFNFWPELDLQSYADILNPASSSYFTDGLNENDGSHLLKEFDSLGENRLDWNYQSNVDSQQKPSGSCISSVSIGKDIHPAPDHCDSPGREKNENNFPTTQSPSSIASISHLDKQTGEPCGEGEELTCKIDFPQQKNNNYKENSKEKLSSEITGNSEKATLKKVKQLSISFRQQQRLLVTIALRFSVN
ncbi:hypothetical protein PGT21_003082 [Puccinia graminis f. sp. tritici]|uniref:Uncharacterized protein n=1 Tax=Puccinia graminis f. sp. tritici TaxID=56615 RepID=A0A5B0PWR1_PUCGR|nr:hypothetical protein PGT21_003082 [Puccinia graminis f. sp. tritici]